MENYKFEKERIYLIQENKLLAEITFPNGNINHTFVDEKMRGKGIASELVEMAVKQIESEGKKVSATCPYAIKWLEKNR